MKKINHRLQGILLTIVFSFLFLTLFYSQALFSPNSYLFGVPEDGIKNYYSYAYHVVHDTSFVHFQGMNYPFGELHSFTDGNPLLANSVKLIYKIFPTTKNYLIGIYNLWMLLGFALASIFLYLILFHFTQDFVWSASGGVAIMILSPQWMRISGHYSLAAAFVIPVSWYLFLRWSEKNSFSNGIAVFITSSLWFFIHPYLGIMVTMFLALYAIFQGIRGKRKETLHSLIFFAVLPVSLYLLYIKLYDFHTGRLKVPWGFFSYNANFDTIFFQKTYLNILAYIKPPKLTSWEGTAYVGTVSGIFFLILLLRYLVRRKWETFLSRNLQFFLVSATIILLFSMSFPFSLYPPSIEKIPFIAQFRSVGRFAWIFYYVVNISAWVFIFNVLKKLGKRRAFLSLLVLAIYAVEAWDAHRLRAKNITRTPNHFAQSPRFLQNLPVKKYQAILPLPLFYIGTGILNKKSPDTIIGKAFFTSFHTGLPFFGTQSSRTSLEEALEIYQMLSRPDKEKRIKKHLTCRKKILVLSEGKDLNEYEEYYYEKAKVINKNLRELQCEILLEKDTSFHPEPKDTVVFLTFDEKETPIKFQGKGAFYTQGKKWNIIKRFQPGKLKPGIYGISLWVYVPDLQNASEFFENIVIETDRWEYLGLNHHIEFAGDWIHLEKTFKIPENFNKKITLFIYEKTKRKKIVILDNLMIWKYEKDKS